MKVEIFAKTSIDTDASPDEIAKRLEQNFAVEHLGDVLYVRKRARPREIAIDIWDEMIESVRLLRDDENNSVNEFLWSRYDHE